MKQKLLKYFLPAAMVAGFLCLFFYDALHYITNIDDSFNDEYVSKMGVVNAAKLFFSNINGRWFSHIITAIGFHFLKNNYTYYAIYVTGMMLLFVASICVLHQTYLKTVLSKEISVLKSISFAFVYTATLYFLLFVGRQEIWAWVSSANNHLLSVILCVVLVTLLLQQTTIIKTIMVLLLAAAIGGLNEVNAVCFVMLVGGLYFLQMRNYIELKLSGVAVVLAILIIAVSLSVNIFSGGYESRMNGLPNFTLPQSLKNTVHTFALPVMQYKFIALRLFALFTFLFFVETNFSGVQLNKKDNMVTVLVFVVVSVSFFLHCYILSDIVPARGEVWSYTMVLFLLYVFVIKRNNLVN